MSNEFDFDQFPEVAIPVTYKGEQYILRDCCEEDQLRYKRALIKATRQGSSGEQSFKEELADLEPLLVSICLYRSDNGKETRVKREELNKWPGRFVSKLFNKCKEITGQGLPDSREMVVKQIELLQKHLRTIDGEESKNLPSATPDTSE